jgi:hypothetical protein
MGWTRWFTYMAAGALSALGFSSNFIEFVHIYVPLPPDDPVVASTETEPRAGEVSLVAVELEVADEALRLFRG